MFAKVLIEYSVKSLDKTFTYIVPKHLEDVLSVGMKVIIPFGRQQLHGFVIEINNKYESEFELKEIIDVVDEKLILNDELLKLGEYLKDKTLCSLITAYQTMLPSSLKVGNRKSDYKIYDIYIELNKSKDEVLKYIENHKRPRQNEILNILINKKRVLKKEINGAPLKMLLELDLVKEFKEQKYRIKLDETEKEEKKELTNDQESAVKKILAGKNKHASYLINGVTGSGKTEVYLHLIDDVLKEGKTAITLVPEISLTAQIVKRFYERFGNEVAIFHSALSSGEKYDEYLKILRGEVKIVVGTRSAIFVPLENIGIIVIDEEHSENYKQDNNPRYHAIDMALFRAKYHNVPLVMGSATPSLESMARAVKGNYELIYLNKRIGNAVLPDVYLIDMAEEMKKRNVIFSDLLKEKINDRLSKKEQIILLLNRRGFSTFVTCQNCGFTYKCPECEITLTFHQSTNNLRCHYCGFHEKKDLKCPECKNDALNYLGLGTEKLEEELKRMYPTARVVRMDADTTTRKGSHEQIINAFADEKYDILVGTQMISKGLDFPKVTLVGVINADTTLNIPDFRSGERTFSLLNQVSGRAGRADLKGEVIVQTFNPENYVFKYVKNSDYINYFKEEMKIRKVLSYPPYYYLVGVKITSKDYDIASRDATKVANFLKNNLDKKSIVLGPTTANMFKVGKIYRFQILIKYKYDSKLETALKDLDELYINNKTANVEFDLNPFRL